MKISDLILELNSYYLKEYGLTPYEINCGKCEDFAFEITDKIKGSHFNWGDELINEDEDPDQYAYHCIIFYKGKYYDSEHPYGVEDFRNISAFKNQ